MTVIAVTGSPLPARPVKWNDIADAIRAEFNAR